MTEQKKISAENAAKMKTAWYAMKRAILAMEMVELDVREAEGLAPNEQVDLSDGTVSRGRMAPAFLQRPQALPVPEAKKPA